MSKNEEKREVSRRSKLVIQIGAIIFFFTLGLLALVPATFSFTLLKKMDYSAMMFDSGFYLGMTYNMFEFGNFLYHKKERAKTRMNYFWSILPSSYLLVAFTWYLMVLSMKLLPDSKMTGEFFAQTVTAFTVFFLMVKIGKEVKNLYNHYHKA